MVRSWPAYTAPAKPITAAPIANACSRSSVARLPEATAVCSLSRTDLSTRPQGEVDMAYPIPTTASRIAPITPISTQR